MQVHSASERSVWYVCLILGRVPGDLIKYPFQTVSKTPLEVRYSPVLHKPAAGENMCSHEE